METNEISEHQIKVYDYVKATDKWVTAKDIARATGVADRTARAHALKLVNLNIFDQQELFPAHRYRLSAYATKRNPGYIKRLDNAKQAFAD